MSQHHGNVHLWGKKVGTVVQFENRKIFFQYDKDFLSQGLEPSPIHLPVVYVLSGNQDDHAKNHAFRMSKKGEWSLSPVFDLSPTFGNGHQMAVNYKTKGVSRDDLIIMANRYDIKKPNEIIEKQSEKRAMDHGVSSSMIATIKKGFK